MTNPAPANHDGEDDSAKEKPEIFRKYQNRNLKDLEFPDFDHDDHAPTEGRCQSQTTDAGAGSSSLGPSIHHHEKARNVVGTVLEESVLDIGHERIKKTTFMKSLDQRFVAELFKTEHCIRSVVYLPGQEIARQGEKADSLIVISKGEAQIVINNVPQQLLKEGDHFGVRNFVGASADRAATIVARSFCDVRLMYREAFTRTLDQCPTSKQDLQHMLLVWRERSDRDGLRATQILSERFGEWLDPPENFDLPKPSQSLRKIGNAPGRAAQAILSSR